MPSGWADLNRRPLDPQVLTTNPVYEPPFASSTIHAGRCGRGGPNRVILSDLVRRSRRPSGHRSGHTRQARVTQQLILTELGVELGHEVGAVDPGPCSTGRVQVAQAL